MAQVLSLSKVDPIVHIKAYGGVKIEGVDQPEVTCEIDAPQLVKMVEEGDHVYITVNASCQLTVPVLSFIEMEGMGSAKIANIKNPIRIEKVSGNLVLTDIKQAVVSKVGGNFSVHSSEGSVQIEKVGGNLIVVNVGSFTCDKIGGSCKVRQVQGDFHLGKAGGNVKAEDITGFLHVRAIGGSFNAKNVLLGGDLKVGGNIHLIGLGLGREAISLQAGDNINLELEDDFEGAIFKLLSGAEDIRIKYKEDALAIKSGSYEYQIGDSGRILGATAGESITISGLINMDEDIVGDLTDHFDFEETRYTEMIRERVETATRFAEAKVRAAEIRLEQMRENLGRNRVQIDDDLILGDQKVPSPAQRPGQPIPPVNRSIGKKGATDEERLMILKMLQDKKISVDEAETLFKALEN